MYNDITPRRGAVRSNSRPPTARPVPILSSRALRQPYGVGQQVSPGVASSTPVSVAPAQDSATVPAVTQVAVPTPRLMQDIRPSAPPTIITSSPPVAPTVALVAENQQTPPPRPQPPVIEKKRKWYQFSKKSLFIIIPVVVALGGGSYIGVDALLGSQQSNNHLQPVAAATSVTSQAKEGTDAAPLPANSLASYTVAADVPRVLRIEKLGIAARVLPMGVNSDGSMQAPVNINDAGWYNASAKPGAKGASVLDGHSSATNAPEKLGLFSALSTLENDDIISVEKGDSSVIRYKVVFKETVKLDQIDMKKVLLPHDGALEGLNLITCAGQWTNKNTTLDHRTIVYTEPIST